MSRIDGNASPPPQHAALLPCSRSLAVHPLSDFNTPRLLPQPRPASSVLLEPTRPLQARALRLFPPLGVPAAAAPGGTDGPRPDSDGRLLCLLSLRRRAVLLQRRPPPTHPPNPYFAERQDSLWSTGCRGLRAPEGLILTLVGVQAPQPATLARPGPTPAPRVGLCTGPLSLPAKRGRRASLALEHHRVHYRKLSRP